MNMLFLLSLKKDKSNQTALNFKKENSVNSDSECNQSQILTLQQGMKMRVEMDFINTLRTHC